MTPEQHQLTAQRNQQTSADQRIGQLHQTVEQQSQILNQMLYQQNFAGTRAQVDQFAETHPRFDELADLIKSELDLGFPLEVAYQRARQAAAPDDTRGSDPHTIGSDPKNVDQRRPRRHGKSATHVPQTDGAERTAKRNTQLDARRSRRQCAVSAMACRGGTNNARPARPDIAKG